MSLVNHSCVVKAQESNVNSYTIAASTFAVNFPFHSKPCERHLGKPPVRLGPVSSAPHRKVEKIKGLQHRKGAAHCRGLSIKNLPHCKSYWQWNHLPWPFWDPWIPRILFSLFPYVFILLTFITQCWSNWIFTCRRLCWSLCLALYKICKTNQRPCY